MLISILILLASCDPTYPITISNSTHESVVILVKTNSHFHTEKEKTGVTQAGLDVYQLNANESIQVGMAIGGIDNDIPFDAIKIVKSKDTVSAIGLEDVKRLFERKLSGNLKKPYVISIK